MCDVHAKPDVKRYDFRLFKHQTKTYRLPFFSSLQKENNDEKEEKIKIRVFRQKQNKTKAKTLPFNGRRSEKVVDDDDDDVEIVGNDFDDDFDDPAREEVHEKEAETTAQSRRGASLFA